MQSKPFFLAVGALIQNDEGACLLVRRSESSSYCPGKWEAPGGKPEKGESISKALVRETGEETGLKIALDILAGASEFPFSPKKPKKQIVMLYMNARIVSGKMSRSKEHQNLKWFPLSKFPKQLTPALKSFVENLKSE